MNLIGKFMSGRYKECLNYPIVILAVFLVVATIVGRHIGDFRFDASQETLIAERDPELTRYRDAMASFRGENFLILTITPVAGDLLGQKNIQYIEDLTQQLEALAGVEGVTSILDLPLLESPPMPLSELAENVITLRSKEVDWDLAVAELTQSPLFSELLISADGKSTALRIGLRDDPDLVRLRQQLDSLREASEPSADQRAQLEMTEARYRAAYDRNLILRDTTLNEIRALRDESGNAFTSYLGGVPLVASDMVAYIKSDITKFGTAVALLIAAMLYFIFRRLRWVLVPLLTTAASVLLTVGLLGYVDQATTVISSNFISLLAIITISFTIHLIARYRELRVATPDERHTVLVRDAMIDKFTPCAYTALTTMVAFGSLTTSEILPVRDFGWIMCLGILISFVVTYSLFAAVLLLLPKGEAASTLHREPVFTRLLEYIATRHTILVLVAAGLSFVVAGFGTSKVSLDNRFIDYFRSNTEVHRGLRFIDENFGGTIPLDIVLRFLPYSDEEEDMDDDFFSEVEDPYPARYWFTADKLKEVQRIHEYLESRPEIGKVLSLSTLEGVARKFNDGKALSGIEISYALGQIPAEFRKELIDPYAAPQDGIMRISARIHETNRNFTYDQLIEDINNFAASETTPLVQDVQVTGMAVLFNSMLKHLFSSQRSTIIFVIAITALMFAVLLRSLTMAVIGLIPNILTALTILAFMGFAGIPLDIMTITIAAIIIGIGVDDAIHYLHRFRVELRETGDVKRAVKNSHSSIGDALYYTSFTVVIGFSVLAFSNFVPTIYFGLLTALAMILALLANLTVLPALLIVAYRKTAGPASA